MSDPRALELETQTCPRCGDSHVCPADNGQFETGALPAPHQMETAAIPHRRAFCVACGAPHRGGPLARSCPACGSGRGNVLLERDSNG